MSRKHHRSHHHHRRHAYPRLTWCGDTLLSDVAFRERRLAIAAGMPAPRANTPDFDHRRAKASLLVLPPKPGSGHASKSKQQRLRKKQSTLSSSSSPLASTVPFLHSLAYSDSLNPAPAQASLSPRPSYLRQPQSSSLYSSSLNYGYQSPSSTLSSLTSATIAANNNNSVINHHPSMNMTETNRNASNHSTNTTTTMTHRRSHTATNFSNPSSAFFHTFSSASLVSNPNNNHHTSSSNLLSPSSPRAAPTTVRPRISNLEKTIKSQSQDSARSPVHKVLRKKERWKNQYHSLNDSNETRGNSNSASRQFLHHYNYQRRQQPHPSHDSATPADQNQTATTPPAHPPHSSPNRGATPVSNHRQRATTTTAPSTSPLAPTLSSPATSPLRPRRQAAVAIARERDKDRDKDRDKEKVKDEPQHDAGCSTGTSAAVQQAQHPATGAAAKREKQGQPHLLPTSPTTPMKGGGDETRDHDEYAPAGADVNNELSATMHTMSLSQGVSGAASDDNGGSHGHAHDPEDGRSSPLDGAGTVLTGSSMSVSLSTSTSMSMSVSSSSSSLWTADDQGRDPRSEVDMWSEEVNLSPNRQCPFRAVGRPGDDEEGEADEEEDDEQDDGEGVDVALSFDRSEC